MCLCLVAQSCPALCNPMNYILPDSSVHGDSPGKNTEVGCHALLQGIFPTRGLNSCLLCLLNWEALSLTNSEEINRRKFSSDQSLSRVWLFATLWTIAHQATLSMGFSRQGYWRRLLCPSHRGSSRPRDWTHISCISWRILYHCTTWEAPTLI